MKGPLQMIDPATATGDMFLDMIQGQTVEVTVGTETSTYEPIIYHLPWALLSVHSGYFHDEIAKQSTSGAPKTSPPTPIATPEPASASLLAPTVKVSLPNADPTAFGLFLRFVYQGQSPFTPTIAHPFGPGTITRPKNTSSTPQPPSIPPSIQSWVLGSFLRAPAFQNHALQYTHAALGRTIFLTPHIVSWVYTNSSSVDALGRLVLDGLISFWSEPTMHVVKSADLDEAWMKVFTTFPGLHRAFLFGLQGKKIQKAQAYLVETPRKAAYASPYVGTSVSAAMTAAKVKKDQVGHMPNLGSYTKTDSPARIAGTKKKEIPQVVIKQEPQTTPLEKMPFALAHGSAMEPTYGHFTPPDPTTTSPLTQERPAASIEQNHAKTPALSKKRSASPTLAQNCPKLPKLLPKVDSESQVLAAKKIEKEKPENELRESAILKVDGKTQTEKPASESIETNDKHN